MKVLIVDDEPLILTGLMRVISEVAPAGTEVRQASHAHEALEMMESYLPDATITDLNMPEKNGFELMDAAQERGLCDRFIILTGYDEFEYARMALRTGVIDYLLKPVDADEIAVLLQRIASELDEAFDSGYSQHVRRILAYVHSHYRTDISLDQLADQMGLHPNYISSLFKKEVGDTLINYLSSLRIREAQKLLQDQRDLSVNAVGRLVGYENRHYFAKVFKKHTGISPGAYRGTGDCGELEG